MNKKNIFKGVATILLMPGGLVLVVVVAAVFAVLFAAAIYVATFLALAGYVGSLVLDFFKSFRKVSDNGIAAPSVAPILRGLPEDEAHRAAEWQRLKASFEAEDRRHSEWLQ